jgi:hypothetical protein
MPSLIPENYMVIEIDFWIWDIKLTTKRPRIKMLTCQRGKLHKLLFVGSLILVLTEPVAEPTPGGPGQLPGLCP